MPQLTHGTAWSGRSGINVVYHGAPGPDGFRRLNWFYRSIPGRRIDAVRTAVLRTIKENAPGWATTYPLYEVTVRPDFTERGKYTYAVYADNPETES